jgi:YidC/Oxa1 family membrane protein insertase
MKRMQALQPQMKAIKEKYKDDPVKANKKTMEFMKEQKVSPLGGCLPMVLQIPVFFGFYKMIQSAIELRGAHFLWVKDLSQPDTLFMIPGTTFPFNLLPLIMGVTMLWQARLTPPSPGMDPMQAKMMRYMPLMFIIFLYNFSAGLALYWTVQNLLTIAQTKLTKMGPEPVPAVKGPVLTPAPKKRK